jgi:hypothetical protein
MCPVRENRDEGTNPHSIIERQRQDSDKEETVDSQEMRSYAGFGNQDKPCLSNDGIIARKELRLNMVERGQTRGTDPFFEFMKGLQTWRKIWHDIDYHTFRGVLEEVKGHAVADGYANELFHLMDNPLTLFERMGPNVFQAFMRKIVEEELLVKGHHQDLIP